MATKTDSAQRFNPFARARNNARNQKTFTRSSGDQRPTRVYTYKTLIEVSTGNDYYDDDNGLCHDFDFVPTPFCQELMRSLGLILRYKRSGFTVMYDTQQEDYLFDYLNRRIDCDEEHPNQPRMAFYAINKNAWFVNFTDLSYETNAASGNFYLSNSQAHYLDQPSQETVLLGANGFINQINDPYLPIVSAQFEVDFDGADEILVCSVSGKVVFCYPKEVPKPLLRKHFVSEINCAMVIEYKLEHEGKAPYDTAERSSVYIDLSSFPMGFYTLKWVTEPAEKIIRTCEVIYTEPDKNPMLFMDFMFTQPCHSDTGIYPVDLPNNTITSVDYNLVFSRREVIWRYWCVPQNSSLEDLSIVDSNGEVEFDGPFPGELSNKSFAWYFDSKTPVPLLQRPNTSFSLLGSIAQTPLRTLVSPLPAASGDTPLQAFEQIGPEQGNVFSRGYYVPIYVYL